MNLLYIYFAVVNVVTFVVYGVDKWKAKNGKWRIPEATLILLAAIGGAFGAKAAMTYFRHKTQHKKFTILVPLLLIVWILGIGYLMQKIALQYHTWS